MNYITYTLTPKRHAYSDFVSARLAEVDTTAGKIVHRWPNGVLNVKFPGVNGGRSLELTVAESDVRRNLERAA